MTHTEMIDLKAALEAKQLELAFQLRSRIGELAIGDGQSELIDWTQRMNDRDLTAGMLNRLSSTLADVQRALTAISENCYGICVGCDSPIAVRRLQSIPWAACCVRCQEQREAAGEGGATNWDERQAA